MTDPELLQGLIDGNPGAVKYLVSQYQKKVIKTAYYFLGNMDDAEDLSQEVFMEILQSVKMFRNASSLSTWIYRITLNKSMNQLKKNRRKAMFYRIGEVLKTQSGGTPFAEEPSLSEQGCEVKENRKLIHEAIIKLPENQRIAFVLHRYDEKSYKEIATIMNLSLSSVESLIHRARVNLQKKLIKQFPEYQNK